jgi:hypothetical protein
MGRADRLVLTAALLVLALAAGEVVVRLGGEEAQTCSTDAECEGQAVYVEAHRGAGRP